MGVGKYSNKPCVFFKVVIVLSTYSFWWRNIDCFCEHIQEWQILLQAHHECDLLPPVHDPLWSPELQAKQVTQEADQTGQQVSHHRGQERSWCHGEETGRWEWGRAGWSQGGGGLASREGQAQWDGHAKQLQQDGTKCLFDNFDLVMYCQIKDLLTDVPLKICKHSVLIFTSLT